MTNTKDKASRRAAAVFQARYATNGASKARMAQVDRAILKRAQSAKGGHS